MTILCSGEDAYKKIRAGATLVQLYTAFAYAGPALLPQIKVCYWSWVYVDETPLYYLYLLGYYYLWFSSPAESNQILLYKVLNSVM